MNYAVIVAGGSGTRMNSTTPKQFLTIHGKPILRYTAESFLRAYHNIQLIVVLPSDFIDLGKEVLHGLAPQHPILFVEGGQSRFHSVKNGLACVAEGSQVFIHDAVRPCINTLFLKSLEDFCHENGNAIPCILVKDSLRKIENDFSQSVDRSVYRIIQTPQVFNSTEIKHAFNLPFQESFTDEASVLEAYGAKVYLCNGLEQNIKITTPTDLTLAGLYLSEYPTD